VDDELPPDTVHLVLLLLGDVVGDVVDGAHLEIARGDAETLHENSRVPVRQHLALAKAKFAAARMAPRYARASSESTGAHASWRSGTLMP